MNHQAGFSTLDDYERRLPEYGNRLAGLSADALKKMARVWIGKDAHRLKKEEAIKTLQRCLRDPKAIRQLMENLTPVERDGLMLIKLRGRGVVYTEELALELLLLHPPALNGRSSYYSTSGKQYGRVNEMLARGLLMRCDGKIDELHRYYSSYVCEAVGIVADVLSVIEISAPPPLPLKPVANAAAPIVRSAGEMLLLFTSFAQAIERLGFLQLNAKGEYAAPSLNKLRKLLGWPKPEEKPSAEGSTPLADPLEFYLGIFHAAELLRINSSSRELVPNPQADLRAVLEEPNTAQARRWARGYRSLRRWNEVFLKGPGIYYSDNDKSVEQTKWNGMRAALLLALGLLPDPSAWYRIEDLSEVIRERIGRQFAIGNLSSYSEPWKATDEQKAAAYSKYEHELVSNWRMIEQVWLDHALRGPLYHLGLVELGAAPQSESGGLTLFRLSEMGRAALYDPFHTPSGPDPRGVAKPAAPEEQPCWIVQPNFETMVYLDQASPRRIGFMERIGVRQKADAAIAIYRLTRESIYAALEAGIKPEELLQTLERGSRHPLPPGVARTLSDWAARRERLALRLDANVLEFPNAAARDAALGGGKVKGAAVGDRFLLTEQSEPTLKQSLPLSGVLGYEPRPPRPLIISDDGGALINPVQHDLLIAGELAALAEPTENPRAWRITRESVQAARSRGWTLDQIIHRLEQRAVEMTIPSFLRYAIAGWYGARDEPGPAALTAAPLLQTTSADAAEAICQCSFLRPHLLERIGPRAFLVKPESVKPLGKLLKEYGFEVGKEVLLPAQPERKK